MTNQFTSNLLGGKTALVTGAGQGNGAAIAKGLAQAGARVIVTDISGDNAERTAGEITAAGGHAIASVHDITSEADCVRVASQVPTKWGDVDILINNAGVLLRGKMSDQDHLQKWRKTVEVNVHGTYLVTSSLLDQLKRSKGAIVNVASIQSFVAPLNSSAYTASKGAVMQLTKALATELAEFGIRVNAIAPGAIETPMSAYTRAHPEAMAAFVGHTPMRRFGKPEELVGPVLFLASSMASYVTGAILPVDGGYLAF